MTEAERAQIVEVGKQVEQHLNHIERVVKDQLSELEIVAGGLSDHDALAVYTACSKIRALGF